MIPGILLPRRLNVLVAKNGRARKYTDSRFSLRNLLVKEMRAEDILMLVDQEMPYSFGLTTTEYVEEYKLQNPENSIVSQTIQWRSKSDKYGQPVMCFLGNSYGILRGSVIRDITVVVNGTTPKFSTKLALEWLSAGRKTICGECNGEKVERAPIPPERVRIVMLKGGLEDLVRGRTGYFCAEIVGTGNTAKRYGLDIYEPPLFWINLALVANKNYLSKLQGE